MCWKEGGVKGITGKRNLTLIGTVENARAASPAGFTAITTIATIANTG